MPLLTGDRLQLGDHSWNTGDPLPESRFVHSYLAAVAQSEHLNLLIGSGLTTALTLASQAAPEISMSSHLKTGNDELDEKIESGATNSSSANARGGVPNIEDRLRVAISMLVGVELLEDPRHELLSSAITETLAKVRESVTAAEASIRGGADGATPSQAKALTLLTAFLSAFASRVPTRDRLHVFTTNYDRVIEWGAEQSGLRIIDRFIGTLEPIFRSSRLAVDLHYASPGNTEPRYLDGVLRLTKLHGSLDWRWNPATRAVVKVPAPFGQAPEIGSGDLLIYPNAAKDFETSFYPYAELFRDFSAAICRPNAALVTYGYSFGDDHINRMLRDMLTIPTSHLVVIAYSDEGNRISAFAEEYQSTGQVSLIVGPTFGDLESLTAKWLPKPSTANIARLQADILSASAAANPGDAK